MPLNVKRFLASIFLVVFSFNILSAQTPTSSPQTTATSPVATTTQPLPPAPTSGEIMRARISKAKAYIAVKNYGAAIYELENIRRETSDQTVHGVLNVLLMNCYVEQGDYKRAQDFLGDLFNGIKANKPNAAANYYAAAGQIIKSARNQSERYKALGLSVSDRNLPPDALNDLEKMRETLEKVVEQSKTLSKDAKQTAGAFALLEETTNARSTLARDDYDARRWKNEVADSREMLANSRSTILSAVNETPTETATTATTAAATVPTVSTNNATNTVASNAPRTLPVPTTEAPSATETAPVFQPVSANPTPNVTKPTSEAIKPTEKPAVTEPARQTEAKKTEPAPPTNNTTAANNPPPTRRDRRVANSPEEKPTETKNGNATAKTETADPASPLSVGSLLEYAVERKPPVYPASARQLRQTGVVRVELVVDENGQVAEVQNLSGPTLLQSAARDAVKKWKFKPFTRDGQPVRATGFVSFNFNL